MKQAFLLALALASAAAVASGGSAATPIHFAGFPAEGAKPSTPTTGELIASLRPTANTIWTVYADGRVVWQRWTASGDATVVPDGASRFATGYVQQRLTPQGVRQLRTKLLATGLFDHNLKLVVGRRHGWVSVSLRTADHVVRVDGLPSPDASGKGHFIRATPAQARALESIAKFVADPTGWLPPTAWAARTIRPFVPACYMLSFDRGYPDIAELPPSAGKALAGFTKLKRHGFQVVTTGQARALLQAFVQAGITPSSNHAWDIDFDAKAMGVSHPSLLQVFPVLPNDHC